MQATASSLAAALTPPRLADLGFATDDFISISNPTTAAVGQLLTARAPVVHAAAATTVAVRVAASLGASALGRAASGGGSVTVLAGAQRLYLYSTLSGAVDSCDDPRAIANGGGWTSGRFGLGQAVNPCAASPARRLTSKGKSTTSTKTSMAQNDEAGVVLVDDVPVTGSNCRHAVLLLMCHS